MYYIDRSYLKVKLSVLSQVFQLSKAVYSSLLEKSELEYACLHKYGNEKEKIKSIHGVCTAKRGEEYLTK